MQTFKKLLFLLSNSERKDAALVLFMISIMALLDVVGVASILPFMAVLTNPSLIETNLILKNMFQVSNVFGVENNQQFLFALGIFVFAILVISLAFKALTTYVQVRFVQMREYTLGKRLVEGYLHQPYSWFLSRHSADIGKTILSEVSQVVVNGFKQIMELIARGLVSFAILILLILTDLKLTLIIGLFIGGTYGIIVLFTRNFLNKIGEERLKNNQLRFTAVIEAFGAAKEVKVGGLEQTYIKSFSQSAKMYAQTQASWQIIAQLPRFILEAIGFGGVLLLILFIMNKTGNFNNAIPILSFYVYAFYRLLPSIQQVYISITTLSFVGPSLNKLIDDITNLKPFNVNQSKIKLPLKTEITLDNVCYNYPDSSRTALRDINLNIPAKTTVGFIGASGSGKTTAVDIILGLLEPQKGQLKVDGQTITKQNSRSWQRSIGYVPQNIYLIDDSVAANIAFGVDPKNINQEAVEKASKIANLHEFITDELPTQYQTLIGERGVKLSGGQRQRIGIARALYHEPQLLIFDEATSALDNLTEQAVMEAVDILNKDITIILIAHRLNTLRNCDIIFKLEKGKLIKQGKFDDIVKSTNN